MHIDHHSLAFSPAGTQRQLTSFHFGQGKSGQKIYIQAALHADEIPGMLVAHHLKQSLTELEPHLTGEVVLVPMANPIGLAQATLHSPQGRFEQNSGANFNRHFPDFYSALKDQLIPQLGADALVNVRLTRRAIAEYLRAQPVHNELDALRQHLLLLAHDADVVLDLHCDFEATLHLYTEHPYLAQGRTLAQFLGARPVLWARGSNTNVGNCFDEALSSVWWRLAEALAERAGPKIPLPLACFSSTVELRGEVDVSHQHASADAQHLIDYLSFIGVLDLPPPTPPALLGEPTPLAGVETVYAPHSGIIVFHVAVGQEVRASQVIADIVDPQTGRVSPVTSTIAGYLFARQNDRFALAHHELAKVAGDTAFRHGNLLSP